MKVAVIFHFLSHYRLPVYNLLSRQKHPDPEYTFFSDTISRDQIKTIDYASAKINPLEGGLIWEKIHNYWFGSIFLWQSGIIGISRKKGFDCIILLGCMYHFSTWISAILARITGKKVLMWTHGYLRNENNLKGWVREKFYKLADGLLLYGNRSKNFLIDRGFDPSKLYVVYNSLDYEEQCRVREKITTENLQHRRKELFLSPDLPVLIFIGRLTLSKKLSQMLQAAKILKEMGKPVNVLFVGDGPEKANLETAAHQCGIANHVHFSGPIYSEEEIGPLMMLADICISPGEIGLTCMHALVYGTPVITHDNADKQGPEWEAVHPGMTGSFFRYDDIQDLARTINEWLNKSFSREQISLNCRAIIEDHYNPTYQVKIINGAVAGITASKIHSS